MNILKKIPILLLFVIAAQGQVKQSPVFNHGLSFQHASRTPVQLTQGVPAVPETSLHILAVMVQFQEDSDDRTTGTGSFDLTVPVKRTLDAPPHNQLYFQNHLKFLENYFWKASDGKLRVTGTVLDSIYRLPHPMRTYSPLHSSATNTELGLLMRDTWLQVDSLAKIWGRPIPFEQYNTFVIFHAGVGRDIDLVSVYGYDPTPFDIPSLYLNTISLDKMNTEWGQGIPVNDSSFYITNTMIIPETENREEIPFPLSINGLMAASVGSRLGLPDLFNTKTGSSAIGRFGLMDGQSIFSWNGAFPPEPSAWEKKFLGWVTPSQIMNGDSIYMLPAVSLLNSPDTMYQVMMSGSEYFLMENRNRDANRDGATVTMNVNGETIIRTWQKDTTDFNESYPDSLYGVVTDVDEFEWSLPGGYNSRTNTFYDGGILIWHIDEAVIEANRSTNMVNADPAHRGVNLMEADGSQDIGRSYSMTQAGYGSENGTALDYWYKGNTARLRQDLNGFTPTSHPSSASNAGANSHIFIGNRTHRDTTGFSERGPQMFARIAIGDSQITLLPGFPKAITGTVGKNSVKSFWYPCVAGLAINTSDALYGWKLDGSSLLNGGDASGILTPPSTVMNSSQVAVGKFFQDSVVEFMTGNGALSAWQNRDANIDGFADSIFSVGIPGTVYAPTVISDSFIVYGSEGNVYFVCDSNGIRTVTTIHLADTSPINGICLLEQPQTFALTTSDGTVAIVTPQGILHTWESGENISTGPVAYTSSSNARQIAIGTTGGEMYLLNDNLERLPGFPFFTGTSFTNSPAIADVDGDGRKDIVFFSANRIYALNEVGVLLDHFPITVGADSPLTSSPVIADIDGNGIIDIIAVASDGLLAAYNMNGDIVNGFPLQVGRNTGSTPAVFLYQSEPCSVCEGCLETICLAIASDDGYVRAWQTGTTTTARISWSQFLHDAQNTGLDESILTIKPRSDQFLPASLAYNWPNPVTANDGFTTHIRYYLHDDATVRVRIFDPAGDLVTEFAGPGVGGVENEVVWDASKYQSGVYFAHVEANGSGKSGYAHIKIAIIR
jgi:hypothetical protein